MAPKISIITATHYRPDFLRRCIISVQRQTFQEYEHLIVSDHCPYARGVYEDFKDDDRIKYYEVETPHTLSHGAVAKNVGIEKSSAPFICYCDDDNFYLPNHLSILHSGIVDSEYDSIYTLGGCRVGEYMSYGEELGMEMYDFSGIVKFIDCDALSVIHKTSVREFGIRWEIASETNLTPPSESFKFKLKLLSGSLKMRHVHLFTCVHTGGRCNYAKSDSSRRQEVADEYMNSLMNMNPGQKYVYPLKDYVEFDTLFARENYRKVNKELMHFLHSKKKAEVKKQFEKW